MIKKKTISWIVAADGRQAQFFIQEPGKKLVQYHVITSHPVRTNPDTRHSLGRSFESVGSARHIIEPHIDDHIQEKQELAKEIAAYLEHAITAKAFNKLILAAPPQMLGLLRKELGEINKVSIQEIEKDLTHFTPQEIQQYIEQYAVI